MQSATSYRQDRMSERVSAVWRTSAGGFEADESADWFFYRDMS